MIVRLVLWNLADSKTTLAELREHLPEAFEPDRWISNEATDRFGLITFGYTPELALAHVRELIGAEPVVFEEFVDRGDAGVVDAGQGGGLGAEPGGRVLS